jgi:hypothetical protein
MGCLLGSPEESICGLVVGVTKIAYVVCEFLLLDK